MPNYLARVAAAGMRTSISAKPPVAGPPILPGHRPPSFTVATGIEQGKGQVIQHDVEEEQVVPALPAATALNKPVPPSAPESTHVEDQVPYTFDATPVIRAPRTLRPVYTAHPASSQLHQEQAAHTSLSTSPALSTGTTMSSSATPAPIAPSIKEPTGKGPVMAGVSLSRASVESSDMPAMAASDAPPTAPVKEVKPTNQIIQSPSLSITDKVRQEREHSVLPVQAAQKRMTTAPMPPTQVNAPPMPPAQPTSRQVKLTIGQVDVQVNNRPPALPVSRSPSTGSPAVTDALEQRYLDRFQLKP